MTRDFAPLYKDGRCVICGGVPYSYEGHAAPHLADGSACVQLRYDREPPTEQVVATDSLPITGDWGGLWDNDHDSYEFKDTNSDLQRRALTELAATRRRVARAAREAK